MKLKSTFATFFILALGVGAGGSAAYYYEENVYKEKFSEFDGASEEYLKQAYRVERDVIENHPIWGDYASSGKIGELRRFLLKDHLKQADLSRIPRMESDADIQALVKEKSLEFLNVGGTEIPYYFYNVPKKYRYVTPMTARGLKIIGERFRKNLKISNPDVFVKFAVSSAVRPSSYQSGLRGRNSNASLESSHSFGVSVDIFYDDFFVFLPDGPEKPEETRDHFETIRRRIGFLMGDALHRQLHSVLHETLIQLQDEGLLYAIIEQNQRTYHITVLPGVKIEEFEE